MTRLFVTLEGIDASGKETQSQLLRQKFQASEHCGLGRLTASLGFPQYTHNHFGSLIRRYLQGEFGDINNNHPLLTALLYSMDRWESKEELLAMTAALTEDKPVSGLVVCDRYVDSNLAHQGAKLQGQARIELMKEIEHIEYEVLGLPKPDAVFFLDLPPSVAMDRLAAKREEEGREISTDIHEENVAYLTDVYETYHQLSHGRSNWYPIACTSVGGRPFASEEIAARIWTTVDMLLQKRQ